MTTEYWLQKKTLGGWSQVTRYDNLDKAKANFLQCVGNGLSGYSWRLCSVQVVEVSMLNDVVPIVHDINTGWIKTIEPKPDSSEWGSFRPADILVQDARQTVSEPVTRPWGQKPISEAPTQNAGLSVGSQHGLSGSVWLVHHQLRKKTRVSADKVDAMIELGYVKGSPRTQFEG